MTKHYILYHLDTSDNNIASIPGAFQAWAAFRPKQPNWKPPVVPGDIVWVLSGTDRKTGGKAYKLAYYFEAAHAPELDGNRFYVRGTTGAFLHQEGSIQSAPWFTAFFASIGNGGLSFQAIHSDYLPHFLTLFEAKSKDDRLTYLLHQSDKEEFVDSVSLQAIKTRRGQADFRQRLLDAYGSRCAISGCTIEDVLEAAHIDPHCEVSNYATSNGLLLRSDLHTLFDLHLIGIDGYGKIVVTKRLLTSEYGKLHGVRLTAPDKLSDRPSAFSLGKRLNTLKEHETREAR